MSDVWLSPSFQYATIWAVESGIIWAFAAMPAVNAAMIRIFLRDEVLRVGTETKRAVKK
jgi:hypothetical protein